ncbi:MAG: ACT domain-containing protein [Candidatus Acidiferrales bacterium]
MRTFFVMDVENRRGVLERIASVLRRRMLQIETIVAAPTPDPARAVITFVVDTDDYGIQRITTGLAKIVEVISIHHRQDASGPVIESAIVHFSDGAGERRASSNPDSLLIHASGNPQAIDRFLKLLEKAGRVDSARTGEEAFPHVPGEHEHREPEIERNAPRR